MQNWASTKANKYKNKTKKNPERTELSKKRYSKGKNESGRGKKNRNMGQQEQTWAEKCTKKSQTKTKNKKKSKQEQKKSADKWAKKSQKEPKKTNKSTNGQKWSDFFVFYCFLISFLLHPWEPIHIHNLPPHTTHITLGELRQRRIMLAKTCEPNGSHRVLFFPRKLCSKARSKAVCLKSMFRGKCLSKALLTAHWSV